MPSDGHPQVEIVARGAAELTARFVDELARSAGVERVELVEVADVVDVVGVPSPERAAGSGDTAPVAVVGIGDGDRAVHRAASSGTVSALVLVNAALSDASIELIGEADGLPVLTVVDPNDRDVVLSAVRGHLAAGHESSRLRATATDDSVMDGIVGWVRDRLADAATCRAISFNTADGWRLHGDLTEPPHASPGPAVVLMHSGRSDRSVFLRLARLIARRGITVLNLDWRGRGESTNRGRFIDFTPDEQAAVPLDVTAAFDVLAELASVDASRLGALGVAHGAGYAAAGALGDARTKALVLLTGFHVADDTTRARLLAGDVEVMYVTGTPHRATTAAMRALYDASRGRRTRFVEYPEGVLGYQLFDLHPDLEPMIADWFAEVLAP